MTPHFLIDWVLHVTPTGWAIAAIVAGALIVLVFTIVRRREHLRAVRELEQATRLELNIPSSLHPIIDPDICIGSGSCLDACPEGRILGMVNGVATLVNAAECIGHGRCASECPVDAIKLVFGTAERGVDLPEIDGNFESARPGVYVIGELAGMGLIKNALIQGLQVAHHLRETIERPAGGPEKIVDVAIVGAGPAGIAAAVGARAAGLSFSLVDQDTVGGTVAHYPRQKIVMTQTVEMPYYGSFGRELISKEELIESFYTMLERARIKVHEKAKVTGIEGERGDFVVTTSRGVMRARRVVLAIGRRGSPRALGVTGEDSPKVAYRLIDPDQYQGKKVLVVGGGDSAVEAATMLAEQSDAEVGIVYRRPEFGRCRPLNKQKLADLLGRKRLRSFLSSEITEVRTDDVLLKVGNAAPEPLKNDYVIACLGGDLPTEFLKSVGVETRKHLGDKAMANPALAGQRKKSRRKGLVAGTIMALVGVGIVAFLAFIGFDYYRLPRELRFRSPSHAMLKPSGLWGHGIGIIATGVMLSNFIYSFRKRLDRFKGKGSIAPWLRFHVFVGLLSPVTILFHSAFQWGNYLATATYVSLVVLMITGVVGRYIFGLVRMDADQPKEASELRRSLQQVWAGLSAELTRRVEASGGGMRRLFELINAPADVPATSPSVFFGRPAEAWQVRRAISQTRPLFLDAGAYKEFHAQATRLRRLDVKLHFHRRFKNLMNQWRIVHVTLSFLLLGLICMHIWISIRVGMKWIWS